MNEHAAPGPFLSVSLRTSGDSGREALPVVGQGSSEVAETVTGSLLLPDGSVLLLTEYVILGREPENAADVASGAALGIVITDPGSGVSRVHASIANRDGVATVTDLGSANGTRLAEPADTAWTVLTAHEPVRLVSGARLRLAGQELRYVAEAPHPTEPRLTEPPPIEGPAAEPAPAEAPSGHAQPTEPKPTEPPATTKTPASSPAPATSAGPLDGIGDYVFVRRLGSGERGEYFLATPPTRLELDAEYVVVKVVQGPTSDDAFRRATRELRAFAAAQSPYLIKVHDAGQDRGLLFYSMDFVAGGSLAAPEVPLDDQGVIRAVSAAARAAHALHEVGIVHQGIMPKRILLGDGTAYLADLGLAQLTTSESFATSIGDIAGLEFLDPALLTGTRGSRASDVWSLAATLNRALAGVGVYGAMSKDPLLAIRAVLTQQPSPSANLAPAIADLVRSCLDADPAARPSTALEFATLLDALEVN